MFEFINYTTSEILHFPKSKFSTIEKCREYIEEWFEEEAKDWEYLGD